MKVKDLKWHHRWFNIVLFTILLPFIIIEFILFPIEYIIFGNDGPFLMGVLIKYSFEESIAINDYDKDVSNFIKRMHQEYPEISFAKIAKIIKRTIKFIERYPKSCVYLSKENQE